MAIVLFRMLAQGYGGENQFEQCYVLRRRNRTERGIHVAQAITENSNLVISQHALTDGRERVPVTRWGDQTLGSQLGDVSVDRRARMLADESGDGARRCHKAFKDFHVERSSCHLLQC